MITPPPVPRPAASGPPPLPMQAAAPHHGVSPAERAADEARTVGYAMAMTGGFFLLVAAFVDFSSAGLPSICTFYLATGLPCGGCGLSRSCSALVRGRLVEAWEYNPFGYFFMACFIVALVGGVLTARRPELKSFVLPSGRFVLRMAVIVSLTLVGYGMWRIYDLVGWAGMSERMRGRFSLTGAASSLPPVVLRHGDKSIRPPGPGAQPPAAGKASPQPPQK
ncbi:hypothetical protein DB346_00305 [Verrucomicrobia bacterium LW23]|nr:hypothetical protein DB346_00305 [Verrucomicrobia bacterium LW23]